LKCRDSPRALTKRPPRSVEVSHPDDKKVAVHPGRARMAMLRSAGHPTIKSGEGSGVVEVLGALRDAIAFGLTVAYSTGVRLLENGSFLLVFVVVMVVLMVTGWRRDKPTI
jgi:hypothetical protein